MPDGAAGQGTPTSGRHSGPQGRGSLPSAFTGRRHGARSAAIGVCHSNVRITPNAGIPPRRNHLGTGGPSRRPPSAGCADRRSAFPCLRVAPPGGLGAMRHVHRPRGAFCDSASAPEYERSGRGRTPTPGERGWNQSDSPADQSSSSRPSIREKCRALPVASRAGRQMAIDAIARSMSSMVVPRFWRTDFQ